MLIVGILAGISLPLYVRYLDRLDNERAERDIKLLELMINTYFADNGVYPKTLADIGNANLLDPWKHPYKYLDVSPISGKKSGARKDKNLVPINSDFDLYSMGPDGKSSPALTANTSRDDIVRANNGRFIGLASEY